MSQDCPSPSLALPDREIPVTEATFGAMRLRLGVEEGLTATDSRETVWPEFDGEDDMLLNCISRVVMAPDGVSLLLTLPYPRPYAMVWQPPRSSSSASYGASLEQLGEGGAVTSASFSPDGVHVALLREDGTIELWLVNASGLWEPGVEWGLVTKLRHETQAGPLAFSSDGRYLFARDGDDPLRWDLRGLAITRVEPDFLFFDSAYSTDNETLVLDGFDGYQAVDARGADLTDSRTPEEWKAEFEGGKNAAANGYTLEVSDTWYLRGFSDEAFEVSDPDGASLFAVALEGVERAGTGPGPQGAVSIDGRYLWVRASDGRRSHIYALEPQDLIAQVEAAGFRSSRSEKARYGIE